LEKTRSQENASKTRRVPTRPLHAVLGGIHVAKVRFEIQLTNGITTVMIKDRNSYKATKIVNALGT
jgi:hypothetical protein